MATRQEHIKNIHKKRTETTRETINNALNGLYSDNLKKLNGTWDYKKIAAHTKLSTKTISRFFAENNLIQKKDKKGQKKDKKELNINYLIKENESLKQELEYLKNNSFLSRIFELFKKTIKGF